MTLSVAFPGTGHVESLRDLYAPPKADWLRINLISSIDGSVAGADGTSATLTRGSDRMVLRAIRGTSDIVLVGASTVRTEGYVLPKSVPLAIVTASGDLSGHRLPVRVERDRVFVLCPASVAQRIDLPGAHVIALGDGTLVSSRAIVDALRIRQFTSIVCEGGPTLAARLLADGVVDELCLSTSPLIGGPTVDPLQVPTPRAMTLDQLLVDASGVSYARWSAARPAID